MPGPGGRPCPRPGRSDPADRLCRPPRGPPLHAHDRLRKRGQGRRCGTRARHHDDRAGGASHPGRGPEHGALPMKPLLFLTRLDPLDDALAAKASGLGYSVLRIPVLATDPGSDGPSLVDRIATLDEETAIVWTSRRAAEPLAQALAMRRGGRPPVLYSLGGESQAPLRGIGRSPLSPTGNARAADLARFIAGRAAKDGIRR